MSRRITEYHPTYHHKKYNLISTPTLCWESSKSRSIFIWMSNHSMLMSP